MNVETNVGQIVLRLIDKHFPKGHPLHSVINRQTVKVGYRCMPSMGVQITRHNPRVLKSRGKQNPSSCNCQKSRVGECPIPGACNTDGVVYQATVKSSGGEVEHYVGLAQNFKTRFRTHRANLAQKKPEGSITLYQHFYSARTIVRVAVNMSKCIYVVWCVKFKGSLLVEAVQSWPLIGRFSETRNDV